MQRDGTIKAFRLAMSYVSACPAYRINRRLTSMLSHAMSYLQGCAITDVRTATAGAASGYTPA